MKKLLNASMAYFILAIAAGVFYREFTKFHHYTGETMLRYVHSHVFALGMILFLALALFCNSTHNLCHNPTFRKFFALYNISLPFMACTMFVRGILQVLNTDMTRTTDAMLSGIAGISHIFMTIALFMLFVSLKKNCIDPSV